MYEEKLQYEDTIVDFESAKNYLKSIGEWDKIKSVDFLGKDIIAEANRIKANRIILTE